MFSPNKIVLQLLNTLLTDISQYSKMSSYEPLIYKCIRIIDKSEKLNVSIDEDLLSKLLLVLKMDKGKKEEKEWLRVISKLCSETLKHHYQHEGTQIPLNKKRILGQIMNFLFSKMNDPEYNETLSKDSNFGKVLRGSLL